MRIRAFAFALVLWSGAGIAQTAQEKAIAEELFNAAKKAYDAGNYAEACPKFADSQKLDPGIGTALYLGGCLEKQGRIASARQSFLDAGALAAKLGDSKRAGVAKARADALSPSTIKIVIDSPPPGLEVRRDGSVVPPNSVDFVDGGSHEITASAPGYQKSSQTVDVPKEKGAIVVSLDLVPIGGSKKTDPVIPPAPPIVTKPQDGDDHPEPKSSGGLSGGKIAGIVIGSVGLVGIAVGAGTALKAKGDFDASNDPLQGGCDPNGNACTRQRGVDLRASASTMATVSTVSFIAGGILVAGGVTLFLLAPSAKTQVSFGPTSLTFSGTF